MPIWVPTSPTNLYPRDYWKVVWEWKTKIIYDNVGIDHAAIMENKNDITAGDGKKHDIIEGKAEASTTITSRTFEYLQSRGIPTHYREQISSTEVLIDSCDMIPLECIGRFVETGSYHKREKSIHGNEANPDGTVLDEFVMEFFYKNDVILTDGSIISDPLMELIPKKQIPRIENGKFVLLHPNTGRKLNYISIENPSTGEILEDEDIQKEIQVISEHAQYLHDQTTQVWSELRSLYIWEDLHLHDFKVEYGKRKKDGKVVLADVIDGDSKRLRKPIILEWENGQRYLWKDVKPWYTINMYLHDKYMTPFKDYAQFMYAVEQYHMNIQQSRPDLEKYFSESLYKNIYREFLRNKKSFSKITSDIDISFENFFILMRQDSGKLREALSTTKRLLQNQIIKLASELEEKYWYNVLDSDDDGELKICQYNLDSLWELFKRLVNIRNNDGYNQYDENIKIKRYVEWEWLDKQWYRDGASTKETGDKYKKLARIITELTQRLKVPTTYVDEFAKNIQMILSHNS